MNDLKLFQQRRNELSSLIDATAKILSEINAKTEVTMLSALKRQLMDNKFKVLVIGEFKRGKSTFINALLREKILPAYSMPCTAIINEIKYGEKEKAIIYFKEKISQIPEGLADDIKSHINQHKNDEKIPPMIVPFDKLEEYVTITDVEKEQAESVAESPFDRAEIYVPCELCKDGVEIIDSPGLNEHQTRSDISNKYAQQADAIIFVLQCESLASQTELESIDELRQGHKNIFFVCNRFDSIRDKDKPSVIQRAKTCLRERTELGERGLHFVSSLRALAARTGEISLDKVKEAEEASNFPKMEAALKDFLVNDRGKIKLQTRAEAIMQKLTKEIPDAIDKLKKLLKKDTRKLQKKYDKLYSETEDLKQLVADSMEILRGRISRIERSIKKAATEFIMKNIAEKVPDWVNECEPDASLGILYTSEGDITKVFSKLVEYVKGRIQETEAEWSKNVMIPKITKEIESFQNGAEKYIGDFNKKISVAGNKFYDTTEDLNADDNADDTDIHFFYIVLNIEPTTDLLKLTGATALCRTIFGLFFHNFCNPFDYFSLDYLKNKPKMDEIKKRVGEMIKQQIQQHPFEKQSTPLESLSEKLNSFVEKLQTGFEDKINSVQEKANQALQNSQLKEQEAEDKAKFYDELLAKAQQLAEKSQAFIESLEEKA